MRKSIEVGRWHNSKTQDGMVVKYSRQDGGAVTLQPPHSLNVVLFASGNDRHKEAEDKRRQGDPPFL